MQNLPVAASGGHRGRFCSCGMPEVPRSARATSTGRFCMTERGASAYTTEHDATACTTGHDATACTTGHDPGPLQTQRPGDDLALDLGGATVDGGHERVADVGLHVVLGRVSVAAHHLHAL